MNRLSFNSYKLGDVTEIIAGGDKPKEFKLIKSDDFNVPVYANAEGDNGLQGYTNVARIIKPSVTVSARGSKVGFTSLRKQPFFPIVRLLTLIPKEDLLDVSYLYYSLKYSRFERSGSGQPQITIPQISNKVISIPDLPTQQKIASVLSALDDKIEINNKINAELEAMAKTLYDYWFVQFEFPITNESHPELVSGSHPKGYKSAGGKMVYNETLKREIPEGWEVKSLYSIADFINGLACQKYRPENESDDFLPVIKIREMNDGISSNTEKVRIDIPEKNKIDDGDILFSWSATLDVKIWTQGKGGLNQHIFKVISKDYPKSFYYFELLNYLEHFKMMAELRKTTMGHITIDHLKTSLIAIPSKELILKMDTKLTPILNKIISNKKQNQELAQLRDWLLPMLMNGQVTVSEVRIGDRINEYANSEVSHEKLVAETFGEYLPKKQHNINDINKELAALIYLMNYGLGANYGNVAVQKAVYNSSVITPNLYSKKHDFVNYNFGTFSKGLADDLSHNPYLKTKKINGFEVYEIEPSKKNEILNVLSSAENKDFVSSINKLIDLYRLPFINKETNKMELLNTVLKIHSDLKTTDIEIIYQAMKDWKIKQDKYSTKAEKFSKQDTQQMIELLLRNNILR